MSVFDDVVKLWDYRLSFGCELGDRFPEGSHFYQGDKTRNETNILHLYQKLLITVIKDS